MYKDEQYIRNIAFDDTKQQTQLTVDLFILHI